MDRFVIYLGARSLVRAISARARHDRPHRAARRHRTGSTAYRQGVLSNLGNPKMAFFFVSLLPQFVVSSTHTFLPVLCLGLIFSVMTFTWLSVYSLTVARAGALFRRSAVLRGLDGLTGAVLIGLGVRVATERA